MNKHNDPLAGVERVHHDTPTQSPVDSNQHSFDLRGYERLVRLAKTKGTENVDSAKLVDALEACIGRIKVMETRPS